MTELIENIKNWGYLRKITINGKPITQAIKTLEECQELLDAVNRNHKGDISDAVGDIVVTLIMQCELQGLEIEECVQGAYDVIKNRKGHLNEVGDFIKEK